MNDLHAMNQELSFSCAFCDEYEELLDQCQADLRKWSDCSDCAIHAHRTGEAVGRELLRLQANFAKSYAVLQQHTNSCERCLMASQVRRFYAGISSCASVAVC